MKDHASMPHGMLDLFLEVVMLLLKITFIVVFSVIGIVALLARGK
jgi:hypothetical protein